MSTDDKNTPGRLPVTAEVGDEGGSFADATQQAETFAGVAGNPRVDPTAAGIVAGEAGEGAGGRRAPEPDDEVTHATERPDTEG